MRVVHLAAGNLYGGVETLLVTLARHRALVPEMEPHFATCFSGQLSRDLRYAGAPVYQLGPARFSRPWTVWGVRRRFRKMLIEMRPDIVICHECWPHALFAPAARGCGLPLVFWAHGLHDGRHWLERRARRASADLVLANSRLTQATLPALFPGVRNEVIHLPVSSADLSDRDGVRGRTRRSLETPDDAIVIVQASRLERWKGHTILLQALAQLQSVPGWVCWIAGGPQRPEEEQYLEELKELARRLGLAERIRFLGQRSDVPALLAASDIYFQPNTGPEPFGIVFVEALYAGLPVMTTAFGGALEIVDRSCGVLLPPGELGSLAVSLRDLVLDRDRRVELGSAGPERARSLCDPEIQLAKLRDLLSELVHEEALT
jgi:glycosyltransferase involved in cell wall biosynthesis